ncbi:hypothetical protein [uncultured Acetatifactor sp.]|uniref:hypothetical protein n=1 Tax=uncultured Acetatifactor sp. TaxID=1671927 RepID=UPI002FE6D43E
MFDDPEHSVEEERFLILGITEHERLCIVSHCYRGEDNVYCTPVKFAVQPDCRPPAG